MSKILFPEQKEYLESFYSNDDPLLRRMEKFALENGIPILENSSAIFFEQILRLFRPKSFLEIGAAIGYSTIRAAKILAPTSKIRTIELSQVNLKAARSFIVEAGFSESIELIDGNALEYLSKKDPEFDFIFLDADKEDYPEYFELIIKCLVPGGVVLVDNLLWKGFVASKNVPAEYKKSTEFIRKFNAQFLTHSQLKSSLIPVGDGLGLGIKVS